MPVFAGPSRMAMSTNSMKYGKPRAGCYEQKESGEEKKKLGAYDGEVQRAQC